MIRLDKYLCDAGAGTRSTVKKWIGWGRVSINGKVVRDPGVKVDERNDTVCLDKQVLCYAAVEYYMLNKPAGVISASKTDLRNPEETCVIDLIQEKHRRDLFPVGRLDRDTEGLLLITNDGALSHALLSPKKHVDKTYFVELSGYLGDDAIKRLEAGVDIGDEKPTLPCQIARAKLREEAKINGADGRTAAAETPEGLKTAGTAGCREIAGIIETSAAAKIPETAEISNRSACLIKIQEGRFHQIKRMFETEELTVTYLKRISMGSLKLDESLKPGTYRPLTPEEIKALKEN